MCQLSFETTTREDRAYHVIQPVRTFGLLALVRFLGWSDGVAAGDSDGLVGLLPGSTLERLEEGWVMVSSTRDANHKGGQGARGKCSYSCMAGWQGRGRGPPGLVLFSHAHLDTGVPARSQDSADVANAFPRLRRDSPVPGTAVAPPAMPYYGTSLPKVRR